MASEDYVKVIIDYGTSSKKKRRDVDTGNFEKIVSSSVCMI